MEFEPQAEIIDIFFLQQMRRIDVMQNPSPKYEQLGKPILKLVTSLEVFSDQQ